jgi:hypothetical protein
MKDMTKRGLAGFFSVLCAIGVGCTNVSRYMAPPPPIEHAKRVIQVPLECKNLAEVLSHAKFGDEIRIAPGTYHLSGPIHLTEKGPSNSIYIGSQGPGNVILDFSAEQEAKGQTGIDLSGDGYYLCRIEVVHAGSFGFYITGGHNFLMYCASHENRNSGTHLDIGANHNHIRYCDSYRNFDPKTLGEDADGFAAKHAIGPGNTFRDCRSYQNADDGFDFWMSPNPIVIEDCVAFRNGYNIWHIPDFQGDGNGFKFGGNYVATAHIARRCISIENPLNGFDQNHNIGALTLEDCVAIRCGKGFPFPEVPRSGVVTLRRNTSFGCQNILEPHVVSEDNHWYGQIPTGNLGPPPRPGHRNIPGAGEVPTTQEPPLIIPEDAPVTGMPSDTPTTGPTTRSFP